jgi:hypothetical protein
MKKDIEKAIREVLVIENKQSLHIAVDRIYDLVDVSNRRELLIADLKEINRPIITMLEIADYERAADYILGNR